MGIWAAKSSDPLLKGNNTRISVGESTTVSCCPTYVKYIFNPTKNHLSCNRGCFVTELPELAARQQQEAKIRDMGE